ncbi:hypothetical protein HDU96_000779 [Phlyctochytrium bullatum]|nr:hypothetical protein HDU96_000779 [Phlyctochytrium bullatum]
MPSRNRPRASAAGILALTLLLDSSVAQWSEPEPFEFATNATLLERRGGDLSLAFIPPPQGNPFSEYGKAFTLLKAAGPGIEAHAFKVATNDLQPVWDVLKKIGNGIYSVKTGAMVKKDGVCAILPVQDSTRYNTVTLTTNSAVSLINGFAFSTLPYVRQKVDTAFGAMFDARVGNFGLCIAFNRDAMLFSINPGFPKAGLPAPKGMEFVEGDTKPIKVALTGFALSWREKGTLAYSSKSFNPWNGYNNLAPSPVVPVAANVWMSIEVKAAVFPKCPICKLSTRLSVFTGASRSAKKYAAGVVVENFRVQVSIFPLLDLGSGFGVWRNDESTPDGADDVCNPSGLFIQLKQAFGIPLLDSVIKKYVDYDMVGGQFDVYASFRPTDGIYGIGFRFVRQMSILGINLGSVNLEVQYVSEREVGRRRIYFGPSNPCKIRCSKYVKGICADIRHMDRFIMENTVSSDYVLLGAEYKNDIKFLSSFAFSLREARFYFAGNPAMIDKTLYFYIYGRVTVLFIVNTDLLVTGTNDRLAFEVSASSPLATVIVSGHADMSRSYRGASNRVSLLKKMYLSEFMKKAANFVVAEFKKFADLVKKGWNEFKDKILYFAKEIEKFFTTGALKFLYPEFKAFAKNFKELGEKMKEFGEKFGSFAKDEAQAYIDAGLALSKGDMKGFGKSLGRVFTDNFVSKGLKKAFNEAFGSVTSVSFVDAPGVQKNGCKNKYRRTSSCKRFLGIDVYCSYKTIPEPLPDPECMKRIARSAFDVKRIADDATKYKSRLEASERKLPAIKAFLDKNQEFKLNTATIDPFRLNLDTSSPASGNLVNKPYNPQVRVTTEVLSNTPGQVLSQPTTRTMSLGNMRFTGLNQNDFLKQIEGKQKEFNEALKKVVMNGQDKLTL